MLKELKKDKFGYVDLDCHVISSEMCDKIGVRHLELEDGLYYFKTNMLDDLNASKGFSLSSRLADNNYFLLSDIMLSRVLREFGFDTTEIYLAKYRGLLGTISRDFNVGHDETLTLSSLYSGSCNSLQRLKTIHMKKNPLSTKTKKYIEKACYARLGVGEVDAHWGNIAVHINGSSDSITLFDFSLTTMATSHSLGGRCWREKLESFYDKDSTTTTPYSVCDNRFMIPQIFEDIASSQFSDRLVLREYLDDLFVFLTNGTMVDISAEVEDQFGVSVPNKFQDSLLYVMNRTGEELENAYNNK